MKHRGVLIKLLWLLGISIAAFVGMGVYGISNTNSTFIWVDNVYRTAEEVRRGSQEIAVPLSELRQLALAIVLAPDPKSQQELNEQQERLTTELDATLNRWKTESGDPSERQAFEKFSEEWQEYKRLKNHTIDLALKRYREEAFINANGAGRTQFQRVNHQLAAWMQTKIDAANQVYQEANTQHERVFRVSLIVIAVLTLIVGGIGFFTTRSIVRPIALLKDAAARIADRETVDKIAVHSRDELGDLARSMETMAVAIQTHMAQQREAEAEVRKLNAGLERRVEARTAELKQAVGELARSNHELEQFAYVASHDLQEPLRMVASYMELLMDRYKGQLDDKADRWIAFALDGTARMKQLISDLLKYARVGTRGKAFEPTDCNKVIVAATANLKKAIEESTAEVGWGSLPTVDGDAVQLNQLFQNLIANAIKFKGDKTPEVRIEAERKEGLWLFSVRDRGIGIEPEFNDKIFVIFQRLHTREEYPGTGIGLAVCKKIVERHGGRIWVESQLGQGATFYFTIPDRKETHHA